MIFTTFSKFGEEKNSIYCVVTLLERNEKSVFLQSYIYTSVHLFHREKKMQYGSIGTSVIGTAGIVGFKSDSLAEVRQSSSSV
jgi:hypothetical protein